MPLEVGFDLLRYNNHLDPALSKDEWSPSEELALFRLHDQLGNKWAVISQRLSTGRYFQSDAELIIP